MNLYFIDTAIVLNLAEGAKNVAKSNSIDTLGTGAKYDKNIEQVHH